ncbi:hypothetical protein LguiB_031825 [Lonicera macranthoides]
MENLSVIELKFGDLEKSIQLLENVKAQIRQLNSSIDMKRDEMGTDLVDHLSPEEKDSLSRLNPEITELKEKLFACRTNCIEMIMPQEQYMLLLVVSFHLHSFLSINVNNRYKRKSVKDLYKMLHKCNEQLQQFSHVNKKALDQYANFTEQREELQKRQEELNAGDEKIKELITVLDQHKDESIERTFKGVAKKFRCIFSELVQGGHGMLVMMKKKDSDQDDDDIDDDEPRAPNMEGRVEKYIGVKTKASFLRGPFCDLAIPIRPLGLGRIRDCEPIPEKGIPVRHTDLGTDLIILSRAFPISLSFSSKLARELECEERALPGSFSSDFPSLYHTKSRFHLHLLHPLSSINVDPSSNLGILKFGGARLNPTLLPRGTSASSSGKGKGKDISS